MNVRSLISVLVVVPLAGGLVVGPASADDSPLVVPLDGAHWQAGTGQPDATDQSSLGLVQDSPSTADTHARMASIRHLPASVTELGFTGQTPSGIDPCWKVGVVTADGSVFTLHLTTDSAQVVTVGGGQGDVAPVFQWTWSLNLPAGDRVTSATAEVMTGETGPFTGGQATLDDFTVNGRTISHP